MTHRRALFNFDFTRVSWLLLTGGAFCCLGGGCGSKSAPLTLAAAPIASLAPPTAAPSPTPTATPEIPKWARGAVLHRIETKEKVIALTFDDGPWPEYTRQILDILKENNIRATFFMVGSVVKEYPSIARDVRDAGHVIANHSWTHPYKTRKPESEVKDTDAILKKVLGITPTLFRPPYGYMKNGMAKVAQSEGEAVIIWSSEGADWSKKATDGSIASQVLAYSSPGGIILLHDGGGNRSHTVNALPRIISTLRNRGYRFVTVPELLYMRQPPKPKQPKKQKGKGKTVPSKAPQNAPVRPLKTQKPVG